MIRVYGGLAFLLISTFCDAKEQTFLLDLTSFYNKTESIQWIRPNGIEQPATFTRLYQGVCAKNVAFKELSSSESRKMIWDLEISKDTSRFQSLIRYEVAMISKKQWRVQVSLLKRIQHTDTSFSDMPLITKSYTGNYSRSPISLSTGVVLYDLDRQDASYSQLHVTCKKSKKNLFSSIKPY